MDIPDLKKDPLIIEWFSITEVEDNTRKIFLQGIRYYTDFVKKTPAELIDEAEQETQDGILMRKRKIKTYIITFREWLKDQDFAPKTVHTHLVAVKSFYKAFDIDLPQLTNKKQFRAIPTEENNIRLEKQQIQEFLKYANVRNRAIILSAASSGLAQADVLNLKVDDFKKGYDEKTLITTLSLRRKKTKTDFITFLSPEATLAVKDYLDYRNRKPNDTNNADHPHVIQAWEKRRVRKDSDYLFVKHDIPNKYLITQDEKDRKMTSHSLMKVFRELARKAGLDTETGKWQIVRSHNLRKFFNSALLNNKAEFFFVEFLMGHTIGSTQAAYFKADPIKLREQYARYVPFLSLTDTEVHVIESEEYTKLKAELDAMKKAFGLRQKEDGSFEFDAEVKLLPETHPLSKRGKTAVITTEKLEDDKES